MLAFFCAHYGTKCPIGDLLTCFFSENAPACPGVRAFWKGVRSWVYRRMPRSRMGCGLGTGRTSRREPHAGTDSQAAAADRTRLDGAWGMECTARKQEPEARNGYTQGRATIRMAGSSRSILNGKAWTFDGESMPRRKKGGPGDSRTSSRFPDGGRYWFRTSDLCRVKAALSP